MIMILIFVIEIKCEVITKTLYSCLCKYNEASYDYNTFIQHSSLYRIFLINWKKNKMERNSSKYKKDCFSFNQDTF